MPRSGVNRTFLLLNLVYFDFILYGLNNYYPTYMKIMVFCLLKPAATLLLFITICPKYEFGRSATFKKQAKTLNKKALAAIAEDCLSLRSKRVPQALQVAN